MPGLVHTSPYLVLGGVNCSIPLEDLGGRAIVESVDQQQGPRATVWIQCPWLQRYTVYRALLGGTVSAGGTIIRTLPGRYPSGPGGSLFCTSIGETEGIKPRTDQDGSVTGIVGYLYYQFVRFPAYFTVPSWDAFAASDPAGIPFTTTTFNTSTEIFSPPLYGWYYEGTSDPVKEGNVSLVRSRCEITMTRHLMPSIPLQQMMQFNGTVNQEQITFANMIFPMGCLMYLGAETHPTGDATTANRTFDIAHKFIGNFSIEWNEFMGEDGDYHFINEVPSGSDPLDRPFDYIDMTTLFTNTL